MIVARSKLPATGQTEKFVEGMKADVAKDKEDLDSFDYVVAISCWSMKLLGLWPLDTRLSHLRCGVCFVMMVVIVLPTITCLFMITDMVIIMDQLSITLSVLQTSIRFIIMKVKAKNLRDVLCNMSCDWARYRHLPVQDRRSILHYAKKGRRINVICLGWMILVLAAYLLTPLGKMWLNGHPGNATSRSLPTEGCFPFSLEQSYAYEVIYTAQSFMSIIGGMAIFSVDSFICVVVFHACGQLELLAATLERYDGTVEHDHAENARSRLCACLSCIVKRHVHIISHMDVVEESFSSFILSQLLTATVMMAFEGFQIVVVVWKILFARNSNIIGFITSIIYGITFTFYIFIYCYVGNCIIEKSENIGRTAYNIEWMNFPRNYARPIILLIARSRRPCKITAGRFATMTLSYYKTIMTTSLSYLSVLMALK